MTSRVLTPEQLELARERKARKLARESTQTIQKPSIARRHWLPILSSPSTVAGRLRVLTFNILAQSLVRRELFPASGSVLKQKDRFPLICEELFADPKVDLICLQVRVASIPCLLLSNDFQEVDVLPRLTPLLGQHGFDHIYASGHGKKHGCLIAFKQAQYQPLAQKIVYYDETSALPSRLGLSFKTKNIGLLLALRSISAPSNGFIVGTTHLFWHPSYTYERARQTMILLREIKDFQATHGPSWPFVLAGDFNFSPDDAAYSLLAGNTLTNDQRNALQASRVVHVSVDPSQPVDKSLLIDREDSEDPDRVITNARQALPEDGLLSDNELESIATQSGNCRSAFDQGMRLLSSSASHHLFKDRVQFPENTQGAFEPCFTAYAHFWKTSLDYIFFQSSSQECHVQGLLEPLKSSTMHPGLPQKGVGGSDHLSVSAELTW